MIVYATTPTELYIKSCYCNIKKKFQIDTSTVFLISYDMDGGTKNRPPQNIKYNGLVGLHLTTVFGVLQSFLVPILFISESIGWEIFQSCYCGCESQMLKTCHDVYEYGGAYGGVFE